MNRNFTLPLLLTMLCLAGTGSYAQNIPDSVLKINAKPIGNPLQRLLLLQPKTFEYNTARFKHLDLATGTQYGFMAENVQAVFPSLVSTRYKQYLFGKNNYRNAVTSQVDSNALIPLLVASIQELHAELEKLKAEILELKK